MLYYSSRNENETATPAEAVVRGLAKDGGLYTMKPDCLPLLDLQQLFSLDYCALAGTVLSTLLPDFSSDELSQMALSSYGGKFPLPDIVPLHLTDNCAFLELFRGPTSAFKDVALCLLPRLMKRSAELCGHKDDILILTATSGDTGKAALEGFRDVPGVRVIVFYPRDGVSAVQRAQMVTQEGRNVCVCAVDGNFDDAQTGVKRIFETFPAGALSSANSINIGRLAPQVVYYFHAYFEAVRKGLIGFGDKLSFSVPTGNFGDILAGFLALRMGLPVGRLICASNSNDVLTDFIHTGVYDRRREFHKTLSPSMDILVSSNLERLLYLLSGDSVLVSSLMAKLNAEGHYRVPDELLEKIQSYFAAYSCDDTQTRAAIRTVWEREHYLCDTHTAVAWSAAERYSSPHPTVILSTASPYKFPAAVLSSVGGECSGDEFEMMSRLEALTGVPMPENLRGLREREVRHTDCVAVGEMPAYVLRRMTEKEWN